MKHDKPRKHIFAITALIVGMGVAISGGPVVWAVLVMVGVPLTVMYLLRGVSQKPT